MIKKKIKLLFNYFATPIFKTTYSFAIISYLFIHNDEMSFFSNIFACLFLSFFIVSLVLGLYENYDKRNKIIIDKEKDFYLLKHLQQILNAHLEIFDYEIKTINNEIKIIDLSQNQIKEKQIKELEKNYNTFLDSFNKWKKEEISFILENKSR